MGAGTSGGGGGKGRGSKGSRGRGTSSGGRGAGGRGNDSAEGSGCGAGGRRNSSAEGRDRGAGNEGADNDEENSDDSGSEGQESRIVVRNTYGRAKRSCSVGDYGKELEEKNNGKISELEFISHVYRLDDPKTVKLKEDIEKALASQPTEPEDEEMADPPPSPNTLKMNQRRKALSLIIQVRPPKKGKAILFPRNSVTEVLGAYEAAKVSAEVHRMVRSLEMSEVPRSFLNEQMHRLADEAFPDHDDPMQQELWSQYMRLATAFVVDALKMNDKVILEILLS
ncbi:hypothetical protein DCAR_0205766 [Daucus carota subsp. sativus]|uniref:Uncharacterized protein n=1 Tax=Daucus carota subsp. sativus TaxID=79200 RepID=A0AAF0WBJ1_DAUCS|nr:hypothetical protein DCAR_0205766 [Daucus carota subsp. sativus]